MMIKGLENWTYEGWLKGVGLFRLKKRRLEYDLITAFQIRKDYYTVYGDQLFFVSTKVIERGNGL